MAFVRVVYVEEEVTYVPVVAAGRKSRKKGRDVDVMVRDPRRDHW